jgi:hypothetical protein
VLGAALLGRVPDAAFRFAPLRSFKQIGGHNSKLKHFLNDPCFFWVRSDYALACVRILGIETLFHVKRPT